MATQNQRPQAAPLTSEEQDKFKGNVINQVRSVLLPQKHGMLFDNLNGKYWKERSDWNQSILTGGAKLVQHELGLFCSSTIQFELHGSNFQGLLRGRCPNSPRKKNLATLLGKNTGNPVQFWQPWIFRFFGDYDQTV